MVTATEGLIDNLELAREMAHGEAFIVDEARVELRRGRVAGAASLLAEAHLVSVLVGKEARPEFADSLDAFIAMPSTKKTKTPQSLLSGKAYYERLGSDKKVVRIIGAYGLRLPQG